MTPPRLSRRTFLTAAGATGLAVGLAATIGTAPAARAAGSGRFYAVANCTTLANMQDWKSRGGTHVLAQVFWDRWQNAAAGPVLANGLAEYRSWLANARSAGLRVIGEFTLQYPPAFVQANVPPFKMQTGTTYTDEHIRDYVWTALGRSYVADFLTKAFAALNQTSDWDLVDTVRVGGLGSGELDYPPSHHSSGGGSIVWWSHGAAAQTGTGLAAGQVVSPHPGHWAFQSTPVGSPASSRDLSLMNWHIKGLTNYMTWLIARHRNAGYGGSLHVLHPSWGVRYERGTGDLNYRYEAAQGCSWGVQMDAYPDAAVHPWQTWVNRAADANPTTDMGAKSPAQYLKILADARGRTALGGENAAHSTDPELTRTFTSSTDGAIGGLGYTAYMHVNYPDLVAGSAGTLANITTLMRNNPA